MLTLEPKERRQQRRTNTRRAEVRQRRYRLVKSIESKVEQGLMSYDDGEDMKMLITDAANAEVRKSEKEVNWS